MSLNQSLYAFAVLALVACGSNTVPTEEDGGKFHGSVVVEQGENSMCLELTTLGTTSEQDAQLTKEMGAMGTFSSVRCDTTGAIGSCTVSKSQEGITVAIASYLLKADEANRSSAPADCEKQGGTWVSL